MNKGEACVAATSDRIAGEDEAADHAQRVLLGFCPVVPRGTQSYSPIATDVGKNQLGGPDSQTESLDGGEHTSYGAATPLLTEKFLLTFAGASNISENNLYVFAPPDF